MQPLTISGWVSHDVNGQPQALADVTVVVTTIVDPRRCGTTFSQGDGGYTINVDLEPVNGEVACIVWFQKPGHQTAQRVIRSTNGVSHLDMEMVALFF